MILVKESVALKKKSPQQHFFALSQSKCKGKISIVNFHVFY